MKSDKAILGSRDAEAEFERLALIYSWDMPLAEARNWPLRLLRRVMDIGTLQDLVSMERQFGRDVLAHALTTAEAGSLRPQSWTFWHNRLKLTAAGDPFPPMPVRRLA